MAKQQRIDPRTVDRRVANRKSAAPSKTRGKSGRPGGRPPAEAQPATLGTWIAGSRPQTLPLAVAAVALGYGAASVLFDPVGDHWARGLGCLIVAIALQIGVNFANDYSDGVRGVDKNRVGPVRLVGSGRAKPRAVLTVALVFFAIAAVAGVLVVWKSGQWWLLAVGAVCIVAAWFYTGGKRPYGYSAFGELAVFVFFGIVPVAGTMFVLTSSPGHVGTVNVEAWLGGVAAGCFAAAVLMANNLRDRERDALVGKRTLSVRLGATGSKALYVALMAAPFLILVFYTLFYIGAGYVYFAVLAAIPAVMIVLTAKTPRELVTALQLTLLTALAWGLGVAAALAFF